MKRYRVKSLSLQGADGSTIFRSGDIITEGDVEDADRKEQEGFIIALPDEKKATTKSSFKLWQWIKTNFSK